MRHLAAALISCLLVFSAAEYAARIWLGSHGNALDATAPILEVDPRLGWRQRANVSEEFIGTMVRTNELGWRTHPLIDASDEALTILILGPSSTFGWGVEESDTYAAQLEANLSKTGPALVFNAGEIGYSTFQGRVMYNESAVSALDPDLVVIAYGVNDLDRNRFYFQSELSDADEFRTPESRAATWMENARRVSGLVRMLVRSADAIRAGATEPSRESGHATTTRVRVTPSEFEDNLTSLIRTARSRGTEPILMTTATALPTLSDDALGSEPLRIRLGTLTYNDILRKVARRERVPVLDLDRVFSGNEPQSLFVDPIHFSVLGHTLVSDGLVHIIRDDLQL